MVSGLALEDDVVVLGNTSLRAETLVKLPDDPDPPKDDDKADDALGKGQEAKADGAREG